MANEKMTDLLVELIHGAHLKNKKGGLGALKRKVAAAAALSEGARKERKVGGASKSDLRKQGGSDQFVQVCTVKRDRRTIEDIEVGPNHATSLLHVSCTLFTLLLLRRRGR